MSCAICNLNIAFECTRGSHGSTFLWIVNEMKVNDNKLAKMSRLCSLCSVCSRWLAPEKEEMINETAPTDSWRWTAEQRLYQLERDCHNTAGSTVPREWWFASVTDLTVAGSLYDRQLLGGHSTEGNETRHPLLPLGARLVSGQANICTTKQTSENLERQAGRAKEFLMKTRLVGIFHCRETSFASHRHRFVCGLILPVGKLMDIFPS